MTLGQYVRKRTGLALGAKGSLENMLTRSLGAGSFAGFWHYWNPIWSYYLARYIMKPSNKLLPTKLAVIVTFLVSGALHDLAVMLIKWKPLCFFTPWFGLMGLLVVISAWLNINYSRLPFWGRAALNIGLIMLSFQSVNLLQRFATTSI